MTDWKKETLTKTRNWLGIYTKKNFIESYKHRKQFKIMVEIKEIKAVGYITLTMDHYPRNG